MANWHNKWYYIEKWFLHSNTKFVINTSIIIFRYRSSYMSIKCDFHFVLRKCSRRTESWRNIQTLEHDKQILITELLCPPKVIRKLCSSLHLRWLHQMILWSSLQFRWICTSLSTKERSTDPAHIKATR